MRVKTRARRSAVFVWAEFLGGYCRQHTYIHGPRRGKVEALPQRGGGSGSLLTAQGVLKDLRSKQAFRGAPPREDLRRKTSPMRPEASAGLEEFFAAPRTGVREV